MRLSIKNLFFAGAIGFAALFSTICGVVSAEEEKNYTIATGSDPLQAYDHLNYGITILQPDLEKQQHGNINIEGIGLFGNGVGIGTENPAGILHVVGTTTIFSGSVGIGTETPATELHVIGTVTASGNMDVLQGTITADSFVGDGSGLTGVSIEGSGDGHSLDAADGSPEDVVFVRDDGNVGIGTNTPSTDLHVIGNVNVSGTVTSNSFISDGSGGLNLAAGAAGGDMKFFANGLLAGHERMRIKSSGNVGIGTTDPKKKLEVNGGDLYLNDTNGKLIMKSPDGSCSLCAPDNNDEWGCTGIPCP